MKRYNKISPLKNINPDVGTLNTPYYKTVFYPEIELDETDIYVVTDFGDRLDILANQFYNDSTLYWIISIANPDKVHLGSLFIPEGTQLRIPLKVDSILDSFYNLNNL